MPMIKPFSVTGIHVYVSVTAIFVVCVFYTVVVRHQLFHTIYVKQNVELITYNCKHSGWDESCHVDRHSSSYYHVHFNGRGRFVKMIGLKK